MSTNKMNGADGTLPFPANRPQDAVDLTEGVSPDIRDNAQLFPAHASSSKSPIKNTNHDYLTAKAVNGDSSSISSPCSSRPSTPSHFSIYPTQHDPAGKSLSDMALLMKTLDFAARKHTCQRRKDVDQTPYINHPIAVANFLSSTGVTDIRVIQAALLHDTVEDTHTTVEEIAEIFGDEVAAIVEECTDNTELDGPERKSEQLRMAAKVSKEAQQVKLADKLHNLESIRRSPPVGWTAKRIQAYFKWAKQVTDICASSHPPLAEKLQYLYETAYTRVDGRYHPCHPDVCGPLNDEEKACIDQRWTCLRAGENPSPRPIFF